MCAIIKKLSFTDKAGIFFAAVRGEFLLRIPVACGVGALYGKTARKVVGRTTIFYAGSNPARRLLR